MRPIFQAGGALPGDHPTYVERQADRDALRTALNGDYLHVIAPRQAGKTSLLKRLAARLEEMGWRCAYVDLSTLMDFSKPAWYAELGKELASSLTSDQIPTLANQIDLRDYLLNQALPWSDGQPRIALFLDEVEGAGKARDADGKPFSDTLFSMLRAIYNDREKLKGTLTVALAGAVDPCELVSDPDISPFNVGQEIGLDDFTLAETRALTKHLADLGLPVDEAVHQAIHDWTNGHPYLIQRICVELEKAARNGSLTALTPDHVDNVVKQVILNPVNPLQQDKNLRHVAKMLSHLSVPATELWSRLRAGETISRREAAGDLYLELYLTGAVEAQTGRLAISNRIYTQAFGERSEPESRQPYEEYAERMLIAFYEGHQYPEYPGVRAHGLPGTILATDAGIVSVDEWQAVGYWTSRKRWDIVAALRELVDRGYIKRMEDDTENQVHPDQWDFRLTPQGKDYARQLLSESDEVDSVSSREAGLTRPTRIFVSSTWEDLQPEREAVENALHRMKDTAFAGMEYFGSRPDTPKEVSLAEVDRSDVYIGIFAHRYGSGITEGEYRLARQRDIPCLIYFKDGSVPVIPAHMERDAEKVAKLEALKRELKQRHTVSFFRSPDHLATQVVTDLHNLLGTAPTTREEPPQFGPKYQINIHEGRGIVIGDQAQVTQHFGSSKATESSAEESSVFADTADQTADQEERLGALSDKLEELVAELLGNVPVDSQIDSLWRPSRWRVADPDYRPTPPLEHSWRKPLPESWSATQCEARRVYRSWYHQARVLVVSILPHEVSSFDDAYPEVLQFINLEVGAPTTLKDRNRLIADFQDRFDGQRSIVDALVNIAFSRDQRGLAQDASESTLSHLDMLRPQHLADNIQQDLALLKDYEDALRYEDDPRRRAKYRREIEQLRESAARYQQEYDDLRAQVTGEPPAAMRDIASWLEYMDRKLDTLLEGQTIMQDDLSELRQAVLARFVASERASIAAVVERLDQSQVMTVEAVLDAIEAEHVSESQLNDTLAAVEKALSEIQQQGTGVPDAALAGEVKQLTEVVKAPQFDMKHKLKITAPLIPLILSYEGEAELGSGLNLEAAWQRLVAKVRGEQ